MEANPNAGTALALPRDPIRAAQYVRMSTDQQEYSIANQMQVNRAYAERRGIVIVRTYADEGKSGLSIETRDSLKQLIKDAVNGQADFATILVYDVSRWGRFQDADESAHYEFICRQAGIRVEYCAEQFENDGTPVAAILKAVKRLMAGEYSRELSVKVFAAQSRLAMMGFRLGGTAGYGLRRLLVDRTRAAKFVLGSGDWKSITTDRVVLVPGPPEEVEMVRRIFFMFVHDRMSEARIARALNAAGFLTERGTHWNQNTIENILRGEKYIGNNVWNRSSFKLKKTRIRNNPEAWLRADGAFEGIVDSSLFEAAQAIFRARLRFTWKGRPRNLSEEEMLDALRRLLKKHGYISQRLIDHTEGMPSRGVYTARFGSMQQAYLQAGYNWKDYRWVTPRYSDEGILKSLKRLLKERGSLSCRIIEGAEGLPTRDIYRQRFGSLFNAYKLIGYTPTWSKHPERPRRLSNEKMLEGLRRLLQERGRLSRDIICDCGYVPSATAYKIRFGSLMQAYRLIGLTGDKYSMLSTRPRGLSTEEMLEALRTLLRERGSLSQKVIEACKQVPSVGQYERHFGSFMRIYELIGYKPKPSAYGAAARNKNQASRRTSRAWNLSCNSSQLRARPACARGDRASLSLSPHQNPSRLLPPAGRKRGTPGNAP